MKKILLLVSSTVLLVNAITAQTSGAGKKMRFGLKVTPSPTWLRSTDTKLVENSGVKLGFGFGLQTEFKINETASFVTGIGGDFLGGKQIYKNGQGYVLSQDNSYTDFTKTDFEGTTANTYSNSITSGDKFYELKSRSAKITYITIPVLLKLMTKDISGFKYFGMFGGNIAVQSKYRATDEIQELKFNPINSKYETAGTSSITDMRPKGDLLPINIGLNAGIGAEYNLSGSTSLFLSVNYLRGFINQYQGTSEIMVDKIADNLNNSKKPSGSKQSAFSDGVQINIGILF